MSLNFKTVSCFILHPRPTKPISRTEQSLEMKLVRKVSKRSKRDLQGLCETLAPDSTVLRTSPTTKIIKEPGFPEVKVRNSDIAKFGTEAKRNTELWQYAQRRPLPYDKTTEKKTALHSKQLKKKYRGDIKLRYRQADNTSGVSLAKNNILKAMFSRKPIKPQTSTNRTRKSSATPNASAASSTASPPTWKGKRNRKAPDYYGFESSVCSISDQETMPTPKRTKPNNLVIETVIQEEALQSPAASRPSYPFNSDFTTITFWSSLTNWMEIFYVHAKQLSFNLNGAIFVLHLALILRRWFNFVCICWLFTCSLKKFGKP